MALAVDSFVEHAVIDRMNKQFLKVTARKLCSAGIIAWKVRMMCVPRTMVWRIQ